MSKRLKYPAVNACPEAVKPNGNHSFILGRCMNCGLSIRVHKERMKETNRARWRKPPRPAVSN
jgi:polyferredoxin